MFCKKTHYRIKKGRDNKNTLSYVSISLLFRLHKKSELGMLPYSDFFVKIPPLSNLFEGREKNDFLKKNTTIYKNAYFCLYF